jgi:hypothetical protein
MTSVLWFIGLAVVCAGLFYVAYVLEPHWVAKDGSRFLTTSETIDHEGKVVTKRREVRGTIMSDGLIMLGKRTVLRTRTSLWRLVGKQSDVRRGRLRYVLDTVPRDEFGEQLVLRVPPKSRLVPRFEALLAERPRPPS